MEEGPIQSFIDDNDQRSCTDGSYALPPVQRLEEIEKDLTAASSEVPGPALSASQQKSFAAKRTSETAERSILTAGFLERHGEIYDDDGATAKKLGDLVDQERSVGQVIESAGQLQQVADRGALVLRASIQELAGEAIGYVEEETAVPARDLAGRERQSRLSSAIQPVKVEWKRPMEKAQATKARAAEAAGPLDAGIATARDAAGGVETIDDFLKGGMR
jgi:hypothetical protein